jgi:hypothetical protein
MEDPAVTNALYWLSWTPLVRNIAAALVAAGVVVEFAEGWVTEPWRKIIDDARTKEVAQLNTDLGKAQAAIATSNAVAAQANEAAAKANAGAAEAALELAKFRSPRFRLLQTSSNAEILTKALQPFAGTKFDVGHQDVGREQWDFLWVLEPLFAKAGWIFVDWIGPQTFKKLNWTMEPHVYGLANVLNVSIELSPETRGKLLPAAEALAAGLKEIGIVAQVEDHPISGTSNNADAVHVLVGIKE